MGSYADVYLTGCALKPGKQGILTPDSSGYYTIPVGGLNVMNSAGMFYDAPAQVKALFNESSELQRMTKKGVLTAANGHPEPLPGESDAAFFARARRVEEHRTCAHIRTIWLDEKNFKSPEGAPIIAIMAEVTPHGELAHVTERSFKNRFSDTCFSIRGFTSNRRVGRVLYKTLIEIITFDLVNEPGILHATKYHAPALENFTAMPVVDDLSRPVSLSMLDDIQREEERRRISLEKMGLTFESHYRPMDSLIAAARRNARPELRMGDTPIL